MSAQSVGEIPKADMSVKMPPEQDLVGKSDVRRYQALRDAKAAQPGGAPKRAVLSDGPGPDQFSINMSDYMRSGGSGGSKSPFQNVGDASGMGGLTVEGSTQSRTMNAMRVSMGEEDGLKPETPIHTMNAVHDVPVHESISKGSAPLSFMSDLGDGRSKTEVGTDKPEAETLDDKVTTEISLQEQAGFHANGNAQEALAKDPSVWRTERRSRAPSMDRQGAALAGRLDSTGMAPPKPEEQRPTMGMRI